MKPVLELISSLLARPPGDRLERLTPWILAILGGLFLVIMVYGYCMATAAP